VESRSASSEAEPRTSYSGILLAGPPASGRRTTVFALETLRRTYAHVPALTTTPDPTVDAEKVTQRHLDELRSWAQLFHEVTLDGHSFTHDRERLVQLREKGRMPVVCVEDAPALDAFDHESDGWLPVLLWCPREVAEQRTADPGRAWARRWERSSKSLAAQSHRFTLSLRTDRLNAVEIARIVHLAAQAEP
jgi:hypothetical protein